MTFEPDTSLAGVIVEPGLGYRRRKLQRYSRGMFRAVVIHTTGAGPLRKAKRWGISPFDAALRIYTRQMDACGHYLVGQEGQVAQLVPEQTVAWHVGAAGARRYHRAGWGSSTHAWWRQRWVGYSSPAELAHGHLWDKGPSTGAPSCNAQTVGIEVVPPADDPRAPWSRLAWQAITSLVLDVCERRHIEVSRGTVLSHSDCHPLKRTAKGAPWDPGPHQWSYERFARKAGVPLVCGPFDATAQHLVS